MRLIFIIGLALLISSCKNSGTTKKETPETETWPLLPFTKSDQVNPVMLPDFTRTFHCPVRNADVRWEEKDVFNPAALVRHDTVFLLYRAEDKIGKYAGTSRIGLAWSTDGLNFNKNPEPVLFPEKDSMNKYEWEGGCEDPRVVEDDKGVYYLTYTAYDGDKARLLIASSPDLLHWKKHGVAFHDFSNGKYLNTWSKSGAIICKYENGKAIASRVNGKYWMYWGDTDIFLANSDDLIHWIPVEDSSGQLWKVFGPRPGKFDSDLVEPGPPAMITSDGILLIYNSRNVPSKGDTSLAEGTYTPSQILFDPNDPSRVTKRMETYFMKPEKDFEINGQVGRVCFVEGLVHFKDKWFLYYGTADSKIAVAVK
jgi:predicted GH43/DUF377 family glycosyl hydrolase